MKKLTEEIKNVLAFYKAKKMSSAENLCNELIKKHSNSEILHNILGLILTEQNKIIEAISCYKKGIKINPSYAMFYNNLGSIYKSQQKYLDAERNYKKSINLDNNIVESHNNLGSLYALVNKYDDAIKCYNQAIKVNNNFFISHYNLGIAYKTLGNFIKSKESLERSLKINPLFFTGHRSLSQITKYKQNDYHMNLLSKIYKDSSIKMKNKTEIVFALAKAKNDTKNYNEAFNYYLEANALRRSEVVYSYEKERNEFEKIKEIFNVDFFKNIKISRNKDKTPLFIIGMPRSGTTLIEQILSNHPKIFGGDELNFLPDEVKKNWDALKNMHAEKNLKPFEKNIKIMGENYIKSIKRLSLKSKHITDKLPINFKWLGLIKLIIPNAKVIHCSRNPKDNCISLFKNYFVNPSLNFSYNLSEIVDYYNLYSNIMDHWKKIFPDYIIEVQYEDLVTNPKKNISYLLDKCNLVWNESCMKFHENKRAIKTASDIQAREKMYTSSIDSWTFYKKNLGNIFKDLNC